MRAGTQLGHTELAQGPEPMLLFPASDLTPGPILLRNNSVHFPIDPAGDSSRAASSGISCRRSPQCPSQGGVSGSLTGVTCLGGTEPPVSSKEQTDGQTGSSRRSGSREGAKGIGSNRGFNRLTAKAQGCRKGGLQGGGGDPHVGYSSILSESHSSSRSENSPHPATRASVSANHF